MDTFIAVCKVHGETEFARNDKGWRRCLKCRYANLQKHQRKAKQTLVDEAGGCCVVCGYGRCTYALQFHHVDPATKSFSIAANSRVAAIDKLRDEAKKCILVCANCHVEIERGIIPCPSLRTVYPV